MEEKRNLYAELGPRLSRLRRERGLSQRELADALSVTRQAVSNWERGRTVPDVGTLSRVIQVLDTDWDQLCGGTAVPRRRFRRRTAAAALACLLAFGAVWAGLAVRSGQTEQLRKDEDAASEPAEDHSAPAALSAPDQTADLRAHGSGLTGGQALADLLETVEETGPVPITAPLAAAFRQAAEDCLFRFLPSYEEGVFADRNAVLTWLYRALSGGPAFTPEQADTWIDQWFSGAQWTNGSTEDYPLVEGKNLYWPSSCYSGTCGYTLRSLEKRGDGSFRAELLVSGTEEAQDGGNLSDRLLTLELTAGDRQLCFQFVGWSALL